MRKFRLFLMAVLAVVAMQNAFARNVGDLFQGYSPGTTTLDRVTYQITSIEDGNLTVAIYDTEMTGNVTFPGTTCDSTSTVFKVTSTAQGNHGLRLSIRNLVNITFSENLETLHAVTFENNHNIKTVTLPKSLVNYYSNSIYGCQNVTAVNIHADNPYYKSVNGVVCNKDGTTLFYYPAGKTETSFTLPTSVTTIKTCAFSRAANLTSITIPAACTTIERVFTVFCYNLTTINVAPANPNYSSVDGMLCDKAGTTLLRCPEGKSGNLVNTTIKILGDGCFITCHKLPYIELTGVEEIQDAAFNTISGTKELVFGPALTSFEPAYWMYGLEKVSFKGGNANFTVDDSGVVYTSDFTELILCPSKLTGDYTTHANTKIIRTGAFQETDRQSIVITSNVEEIRGSSFSYAEATSIVFQEPSKLKTIGRGAFWNLPNITTITLPASLETLSDLAFERCGPLQSVYIRSGSKLSSIGNEVFKECPNLTTFQFLGTHEADELTIGDRAFLHCSNFVGKSAAEGFMFPKNVTKIGESAFNGCESLTKVTFDDNAILDTIGYCAFQNCGLLSVDISKSVRFIGNEAFNSCYNLKTATIPAATTYVGPQAFLYCSSLTDILVDKGNQNYSSCDGMLASKDKKRLYAFPAGKASTYYTMLSPSFEIIHDSAFYYNRNLKSVTIPKKVTSIGEHAFALCQDLERINFLANDPILDVHEEAFIDMARNSRLPEIDIYVRNGHADDYAESPIWGSGKVKSINESFLVNDGNGEVEYFPLSSTDASVVDVHSDVTTFVVPEKVPGNTAYNVKLIGDYAFEDCTTDIEEVVVPGSIALNYVGARAFIKDDTALKPIKNVFIVGSTPSELATSAFGLHDEGVTDNYDEVTTGQMIYVKKAATADYKTAWNTLADQIDYKIPGIALNNTYGTFAREFDVDLSDYFKEYGAGKVFAFTSAPDQTIYEGSGDGNVPGTWYIRMYSINEDKNGDGIYIPAYTGVLLKSMGGAATPTESSADGAYYYTIGDSTTVNTNVSSVLEGVTVKTRTVVDINKDIYVMSGGVFKPLNGKTVASFPVHKAYLQLPSSHYPGVNTSGAKLSFVFEDSFGETTVVDGLFMDGELVMDSGSLYDLQGRKMENGTLPKGIYVRNGKKIVIK